ncbi:MAG: hypothetical protein Cons2KO_01290 [Congregibacter sp.]
MDLQNGVAVVTGGAAGIGLGTARYLQNVGARVILGDVDDRALHQLRPSDQMRGISCDVTQDADVERLARVAEKWGDVEFLMANAGVAVGRLGLFGKPGHQRPRIG